MDAVKQFSFEAEALEKLANQNKRSYQSAQPFPHIVLDDFLPTWVIDGILAEFPPPPRIVRLSGWNDGITQYRKYELSDDKKLPPFTRDVVAELNSATFLKFLQTLTGISDLKADPHLWGGGIHQSERGGFLKIHADFNRHPLMPLERRLNLLLYLNKDWKEEWGGHLELWNKDMTKCESRTLPIANRCVIFNTDDFSYHGHPDQLNCPLEKTRKSLALYYYTEGRPQKEVSEKHSTLFHLRPSDTDYSSKLRSALKKAGLYFYDLVRYVRIKLKSKK